MSAYVCQLIWSIGTIFAITIIADAIAIFYGSEKSKTDRKIATNINLFTKGKEIGKESKHLKHDEVLKALKDIVGEESATDNEIVLAPYSYDVRELSTPTRPAGHGEFVVTPETPQQISDIFKLANKLNVLVTPVVFETDLGENAISVADPVPIWFTDSKLDSKRAGAAIPVEGGIIMDLHRMNKVVEINEDDYYAVVEPGVSMAALESELRSRGLWFPLPLFAANATSVVTNLLLGGVGHFSAKIGSQADLINGLEAILPTGEVIRAGSCAFADSWHAKGPIPDITGLFIGWQGMTGVVTKIGVKLYKRPWFEMTVELGFDDYYEAINKCMIPFQRMDIAHDVSSATWNFHNIQKYQDPMPPRPKEDPLMYVYMSLCGNTEEEMHFKKKMLDDFINQQIKAGAFNSFKEVPPSSEISDFRRGGDAWISSMVPASQWVPMLSEFERIMTDFGVAPATRCTLLAGSHQGMLDCRWSYEYENWNEIKRMLEMSQELLKIVIAHKGQMYKAPVWASEMMLAYAHSGYKGLMHRIKRMLDPNNIMNPGRWDM